MGKEFEMKTFLEAKILYQQRPKQGEWGAEDLVVDAGAIVEGLKTLKGKSRDKSANVLAGLAWMFETLSRNTYTFNVASDSVRDGPVTIDLYGKPLSIDSASHLNPVADILQSGLSIRFDPFGASLSVHSSGRLFYQPAQQTYPFDQVMNTWIGLLTGEEQTKMARGILGLIRSVPPLTFDNAL